jgi:hypothetical protein
VTDEAPLTMGATVVDDHGRTLCPVCGCPLRLYPQITPDEQMCGPSTCARWRTTGVFDHAAGEWLPVDADGRVPDGRYVDDVPGDHGGLTPG